MRAFQTSAVLFCLACICAEVVTLLTDSGWARRCIKALAGLYILVVLLRALPGAKTELRETVLLETSPVSIAGIEEQILAQTQSQLEEELETACREKFGIDAQIQVILEQDGQTLRPEQVIMTVPGGSEAACERAAEYLRQTLDIEPQIRSKEDTGG